MVYHYRSAVTTNIKTIFVLKFLLSKNSENKSKQTQLCQDSVGPCVISCQMFVKSEFPLDSALVCDSDQKKFGWHFFASSKVMKSKMAAMDFMNCTLCHIFAAS